MIFKNQKLGGLFLLASQMLERIAFYSIVANFVYVLSSKPLSWSLISAMNCTFILSGWCFVATMFGGILADTIIKKSTTVIIGYIFYSAFVGYIIIFFENKTIKSMKLSPFCTNRNESVFMFQERCSNIIMPVTFLCGIGSGLIKSVVASIGADMALQKWVNPSLFFNMYYWSLNFGSLIAYIAVAYVQQNISRFYGFLIPGIVLVLSFIFFMMGMPYYVNVKKPSKNTLNLVSHIYFEAIWKKLFNKNKKFIEIQKDNDSKMTSRGSLNKSGNSFKKRQNNRNNKENIIEILKKSHDDISIELKRSYEPQNLHVSILSDSDISTDESSSFPEMTLSLSVKDVSFLDRCKIRFGGSFTEDDVENVRKFSSVLVIIIFLIPYWIIYFQMETTYLTQALHMNLVSANPQIAVPACWLSTMDIFIIMCLLPILVKFVYPFLIKKNLHPNGSTRIVFGMALAALSVSIAGILEQFVLDDFENNRTDMQIIGGTSYPNSNISVFYQIPQYLVMGLSESQSIVAGLEMACTQVPNSMQGMTNGIFWFISGIGSFIGTGLVTAFGMNNNYKIQKHNPNTRYYFFWIALIQVGSLMIFLPFVQQIRKKEKNDIFPASIV